MHRISISRITHGLDAVFLVLLTLLWLVILAVSSVQARVLDFTVAVNQAKPCFTVQPNNATTLHWMGDEGSRSTESADVLTVASGSSQDDPPDDKPHKPFGIRPCFDTLVESVSWQPMYAEKMVVGYRLWLSLQEDSLSIKGFSWWPVVAGVVLGKFLYTWWHSEASSFHQWEEQHHASNQKIITCMDHPPGQSGYPQGEGGPGVSNQGTGGYHHDRENSFSMYGGYSPSGGGGGDHDPQDGHTRNHRPCPACCQQPCRYPVESNSRHCGQPDSSINDALPLSCYPPEPGVSTKYESTAVSLQASVQPPVPGWPSDHEPNDPGCVCRRCLDLLIQCAATCEGQGGNCVEGATSVENSDVSERPTAVIFPCPGTTSESDVHQQPELAEESKPSSRKSSLSSQKKPPKGKWACSHPGCTKSYSSAQGVREHEASHQGKWACSHPGCTRSYNSARGLREHEASHQGKWACSHPGCTKSYSSAHRLREHKASHQGKWACSHPGCTRSYSSSQALREHKASHLDKWACSYPGCTKSYSSAQTLREHKASHLGKWACSHPGCTRSYNSARGLREHKASHLGKWACSHPGCTRSYRSAQAVKEHEASHEGKWACSHPGCTKSYSGPHRLREHKASHLGKWACSHPGCTRSYSSAQAVKEHEASHEGKWACSHPGCTKSYSSAHRLREHKASHLDKWACSYLGCARSYSSAHGLKVHEASHKGK